MPAPDFEKWLELSDLLAGLRRDLDVPVDRLPCGQIEPPEVGFALDGVCRRFAESGALPESLSAPLQQWLWVRALLSDQAVAALARSGAAVPQSRKAALDQLLIEMWHDRLKALWPSVPPPGRRFRHE